MLRLAIAIVILSVALAAFIVYWDEVVGTYEHWRGGRTARSAVERGEFLMLDTISPTAEARGYPGIQAFWLWPSCNATENTLDVLDEVRESGLIDVDVFDRHPSQVAPDTLAVVYCEERQRAVNILVSVANRPDLPVGFISGYNRAILAGIRESREYRELLPSN